MQLTIQREDQQLRKRLQVTNSMCFKIVFKILPEYSGLAVNLKRALLSSRSAEAQASIFQHFLI